MTTVPAAPALTEEEIKRRVFDHLSWDDRLSSSNIEVSVSGSKVVLSGSVPSYALRQIAELDVLALHGVRVVNELAVKFPAGAGTIEDRTVRENIVNLLRMNSNIDEHRITVQVTAGTVILEGAVNTFWQKMRAQAVASEIRGVNAVFNKLVVTPSKDVLDEVIAEDIEAALDRTVSINVNQINVSVDRGIVTLSGTVPDRISYTAAEEITQHTNGVRDIRNNLVIGFAPSD